MEGYNIHPLFRKFNSFRLSPPFLLQDADWLAVVGCHGNVVIAVVVGCIIDLCISALQSYIYQYMGVGPLAPGDGNNQVIVLLLCLWICTTFSDLSYDSIQLQYVACGSKWL